jgi:hypothetical protein
MLICRRLCDSRCVAIKSLYQCLPQSSSASRFNARAERYSRRQLFANAAIAASRVVTAEGA